MERLTFGPAGGLGGDPFNDYLIPQGATLREIHIFADNYIDAVQLVYTQANGRSDKLPRVGGLSGIKHVITLADGETITELSGSYGWYIDQLAIKTNKQTYGPYGGHSGSQPFKLVVPPGRTVIGLFGRAAWYIDAIGLITGPIASAASPKTAPAKPKATKPKAKSTAKPKTKPKVAKPNANKTGQPKDLQKVDGIGPKIASLLIADGILDLADLSKARVANIQAILDKAGSRYRIANPETWPEQAAFGAKGDWDGLQTLQETLKGGRRK